MDSNNEVKTLIANQGYGSISQQSSPDSEKSQKENEDKEKEKDKSVRKLIFEMKWRQRLVLLLSIFVEFSAAASIALMAPFLPLEAESKGLSDTWVGVIFAVSPFVNFAASIFLGRYISTIGPRFMFNAGGFLATGSTILFGILEWSPIGNTFLVLALACRIVGALGFTMSNTSVMAMAGSEFPDYATTVVGLLETFYGLGLMAGPPIGGAFYEIDGFYLPFVIIGSFFGVVCVTCFFVLPATIEVQPKNRGNMFKSFMTTPLVHIAGLSVMTASLLVAFLEPIFAKYMGNIHFYFLKFILSN